MPRGRTAHRVASRWAGFGIGDGDASRSIFWTSRSIAVDVRNRFNVGKIVSVAKKNSSRRATAVAPKERFSRCSNSLKSPEKPSIFR
jgi:hypothetical protein